LSPRYREEGSPELLSTEVVIEAASGADCIPAKTVTGKIRVLGDYELLEEIARGGMGVVFKARQVSLNRPVAVKLMLSGKFASEEFVRRFRGEAEAVASLQHPNIVAIHEVGEEAGLHYFSMDYVAGQDLAERTRDNPLPPDVAADYLQTIAEAVHYAHTRGILHRDLKPSNVLIDDLDRPRITDFGLAKRLRGDANLTSTGQLLGSPNYMPPEQAESNRGPVGPASDVYSLGAILYHLLTGRPPFLADGVEETLNRLMNTEPVAPRLLNPAIPRELETICLKCLEKKPRQRYATAEALAEDLERWRRREPIQARPSTWWYRALKWTRRRPAVVTMAAALTLSIGLGVPTVLWSWRATVMARRQAAELAKAERHARERAEQVAVLIEMQLAEEHFQRFDRPRGLAHLAMAARQFRSSPALAGSLFRALVANPQTLSAEFDPEDGHVVSAVSRETVVRVEEPLVPIPDWIPELTEALAGEKFDNLGKVYYLPPETLAQLKRRLLGSTSSDVWTRWARAALVEPPVSTNTVVSPDHAARRQGKAVCTLYCLPKQDSLFALRPISARDGSQELGSTCQSRRPPSPEKMNKKQHTKP